MQRRFEAIEHPDGYWYVWDATENDEEQRFFGGQAEELAVGAAAAANRAAQLPARRVGTGPLREQLDGLRDSMAAAAQEIYDAWEQDDRGFDEELGSGGICDQIASRISDLIEADTVDGGHEGDDHAYIIVTDWVSEAYIVDIHPSHYETGSGYSWKKIPDVRFSADMITIAAINVEDIADRRDEW